MKSIIKEYEKHLSHRAMSSNTIDCYVRNINQFFENYCGEDENLLREATMLDVKYYLGSNKKDSAFRSKRQIVAALKEFYTWFLESGKRRSTGNPAGSITIYSVPEVKIKLTPADINTIIASIPLNNHVDLRNRVMLTMLSELSLKNQDIIGMTVDQVNIDRHEVVVTRNNELVHVGLSWNTWFYLKTYIEGYRPHFGDVGEILFPSSNGKIMTRQNLWRALKRYGKNVGYENIDTGDIRNILSRRR